MFGRDFVVDIEYIEIFSVVGTVCGVEPLMEKIIENCKINVVNQCEYQFSPVGATILYLLSESHLTIPTYPQNKACSINLYICNSNTYFAEALSIIDDYFNKPYITKKIMER